MSELLKKYQESDKLRPVQARQIPGLAVDMFDTLGSFQKGFVPFEKPGDPTKYTDTALKYYDKERKEIVIPSNFVPTDQGIDLSRWTPDKPYFQVGQSSK